MNCNYITLMSEYRCNAVLLSQWVEGTCCTAIVVVLPDNRLRQTFVIVLGSAGDSQEIILRTEVDVLQIVLRIITVTSLILGHWIGVVPRLQSGELSLDVSLTEVNTCRTLHASLYQRIAIPIGRTCTKLIACTELHTLTTLAVHWRKA